MHVGFCADLYFGGLYVNSCMGMFGSENTYKSKNKILQITIYGYEQ